jgi:cation diffusion facilitator CzcD-associated flavoprotein CzcO
MAQASSPGFVAIVGAGPYGLSAAAHLRDAGVATRVFGEVMEFWHTHMPRGMILRSRKRSSNICDPGRELTIADYGAIPGDEMANATLSDFLGYAHWFQRHAVPQVDRRRVTRIERNGRFELTLDDGETFGADRVVVAAGLSPFAWRPVPFDALPRTLCSHSSEHTDLSGFANRVVAVIGAGQSALESAALLHESGARAEAFVRGPAVRWLLADSDQRSFGDRLLPPTDVGGRVTGWIAAVPDLFRRMPERLRPVISYRCIQPAGAGWLVPRLADVPITTRRTVTAAAAENGGVRLVFDNGDQRVVDHVLLGTGYRIDVTAYPFMSEQIIGSLEHAGGYPMLGPGLESSVPGLHFLGASAALSFGPIMRFVVGTRYAAPTLARHILGKRRLPARFAF